MAIQLEDGRGRGFNASVSEANRLNVSSKSNPRMFYISRDEQRAFSVVATDSSAAAGDIFFQLKNTSTTRNMILDSIAVSAVNAAAIKLWVVTGTAASGTSLTPSNLNLTSGITAEAEAMSGEAAAITGLTTGNLLAAGRLTASAFTPFDPRNSIILGPADQIALEYDAGTTGAAEAMALFYYEDIGRAN